MIRARLHTDLSFCYHPLMNTESKVNVGDVVSYEDMANPKQVGMVVNFRDSQWGRDFEIMWEDGTASYSDCRQHGWQRAAA